MAADNPPRGTYDIALEIDRAFGTPAFDLNALLIRELVEAAVPPNHYHDVAKELSNDRTTAGRAPKRTR